MKKPLLIFLLALAALLLVCCSPAPTGGTAAPTPAAQPSSTAPGAPPAPPTPPAPAPTLPPRATPDPALVGTVSAASQPQVIETAISPDGGWLAQVVRYECTPAGEGESYAYEQLLVGENSPAADPVVIAEQLQACGGLGAFGLGNLLWAPESAYLYYSEARQGQPDGQPCFWEPSLIRYAVDGGESQALSPGPLSPDGRTLVLREGGDLVLWDLDRGESGRFSPAVPGLFIVQAAWSESGDTLLLLFHDTPDCSNPGKSYLIRATLPGPDQEVLLESETPAFTSFTWESAAIVLLNGTDGGRWRYNLQTGALEALS